MNLPNDYKNPELARKLSQAIADTVGDRPFSIMEVCGGQTHTIYKYKLREMLPPNMRLVSGPGCPVCVTPIEYVDKAVCLGLEHDVSVFTFGDLVTTPSRPVTIEILMDFTVTDAPSDDGLSFTNLLDGVSPAGPGVDLAAFVVREPELAVSKGVIGMKLRDEDHIMAFGMAQNTIQGPAVITGKGREINVSERKFGVSKRGGRGNVVLQRGSIDTWIRMPSVLLGTSEDAPADDETEEVQG